jgi:hypothetical protein
MYICIDIHTYLLCNSFLEFSESSACVCVFVCVCVCVFSFSNNYENKQR